MGRRAEIVPVEGLTRRQGRARLASAVPIEALVVGARAMSNTSLAVVVVLLGICVALALTNPTSQDYGAFLQAQLGLAVDRMDRTLPAQEQELLRGLYAANGKNLVALVLEKYTRRRNFGLFSLFESRVLEQKVVVVGVASRFIPVEGVEEAVLEIGRLVSALRK
jgi:hypothetical protein